MNPVMDCLAHYLPKIKETLERSAEIHDIFEQTTVLVLII